MLHFSRITSIVGAPLAIVALLTSVSFADAKLGANKLGANGVAQNGILPSERMTAGSALADLNGVAVEAVILTGAALR